MFFHFFDSFEGCSRWEEVTHSLQIIASCADCAQTPLEIRLLNKADPIMIGQSLDDSVSLAAIKNLITMEPSGLTPICKQIRFIIDRIKSMKDELISNNRIVVLIIMTDGESTDGSVADTLKPLEGLPVQIIIRICTDESDVSEYWHDVNAQLDINIQVLDDLEATSTVVSEYNTWLTYGEPLHIAREFGMMLPAFNVLDERLLTRTEIGNVARVLLEGGANFPDADTNWESFLLSVKHSLEQTKNVFCPIKKTLCPWLDVEILSKYTPDPLKIILEQNEVIKLFPSLA